MQNSIIKSYKALTSLKTNFLVKPAYAHRKRNSLKGFTLIEILVALGIFSVVVLSLYGSFWAGMKINKRAHQNDNVYRQIAFGLEEMTRDLEQSVSYDFSQFQQGVNAFEGSSAEISFLLPTEEGLKQVHYYLVAEDETFIHRVVIGEHYEKNVSFTVMNQSAPSRYALIREEKLFVDVLANFSSFGPEVVALGIAEGGLQFSYAFLQQEGDAAKIVWEDVWGKDYIPAGMKIKISFLNAEKKDGLQEIEKSVYIPTGFWGEDEV